MRLLPLLLMSVGIVGCTSVQQPALTYESLDGYMKTKPILSTPRDDLLFVNLDCFEDLDLNGKYKKSHTYSYQGFLGEGIYSEHYYLWDEQRNIKEQGYNDIHENLTEKDVEGLFFEFSMQEDDSGEYISSLNLIKRTFVREKEFNNGERANVFKHIEYNKEYYAKNKQPIKVYDDKEDVCYVTASW